VVHVKCRLCGKEIGDKPIAWVVAPPGHLVRYEYVHRECVEAKPAARPFHARTDMRKRRGAPRGDGDER